MKEIDLDEGFIANFVIDKSANIILNKIANKSKKDFDTFALYVKAAGFEKPLLKVIKQFFKIKASKLELISRVELPKMKVESLEDHYLDEGIFDSITDTFDNITKYFNLYRVYNQIKDLDGRNGFIANNKKLIFSSLIWLLCINGKLVEWVKNFKKELMA